MSELDVERIEEFGFEEQQSLELLSHYQKAVANDFHEMRVLWDEKNIQQLLYIFSMSLKKILYYCRLANCSNRFVMLCHSFLLILIKISEDIINENFHSDSFRFVLFYSIPDFSYS